MKFLKSLFGIKSDIITVTVSNRNIARVRALILEGFKAIFNAATRVWVLTKAM